MNMHDLKRKVEKIGGCMDAEFTEDTLKLLLEGMGLIFSFSKKFRRNIENFRGRYVFRSMDGSFIVSASFEDGTMKVREGEISNPNIRILFKNTQALRNFIFSPKPDVLNAMLNQEVTLDGNLNYLYKFAYMANHLRLNGLKLLS